MRIKFFNFGRFLLRRQGAFKKLVFSSFLYFHAQKFSSIQVNTEVIQDTQFYEEIEVTLEKPLEPLELRAITFKDSENKEIPFILLRTGVNEVKAFYRYCPHDRKADLSKGFVLYDKLVCPNHGCVFNI